MLKLQAKNNEIKWTNFFCDLWKKYAKKKPKKAKNIN